jgi:hypothetical protein
MSGKALGQTLDELLGDLLAEERSVRDSIIQRGATLITGSGALVALSLGISTLSRSSLSSSVGVLPKALLGTALVLLLASTGMALTIAAPWVNRTVDLEALPRNLRIAAWNAEDAQRAIDAYEARLQIALSLQDANRSRGALLRTAIAIQTVGLLLLAAAVAAVLLS